jgi:hypothetical protein
LIPFSKLRGKKGVRMAYNIKIEEYPDGVKVYKYKVPIKEGRTSYKKNKHDEFDYSSDYGEVQEENKEKTAKTIDEKEKILISSLNRTKNIIYKLARSNDFDWFVTCTMSPNKVKRDNYCQVSKKFSQFLKNYQRREEKLSYIFVPELHSDKKTYHFHGLVNGINKKNISPGINPHTGKEIKDKKGRIIYNWNKFNLGYTTLTPISNGYHPVSWYLSKYITKDIMLKSKDKKRYWTSKDINRPKEIKMYLETENLMEHVINSYRNLYKKNDSQTTINVENGTYKNTIDIYDFY